MEHYPHFLEMCVCDLLDKNFQYTYMVREAWPSHSPNLMSLNSSLLGSDKGRLTDVADMKNRINGFFSRDNKSKSLPK